LYPKIKKTDAGKNKYYGQEPDFGFNVAKVVGSFKKRDYTPFPVFSINENQRCSHWHSKWKLK
jgi:hypothetical protein